MLMEMSMKENGKMTKLTAQEYTLTWTELNILDLGSKINNMAKALKSGQMARSTKVTI